MAKAREASPTPMLARTGATPLPLCFVAVLFFCWVLEWFQQVFSRFLIVFQQVLVGCYQVFGRFSIVQQVLSSFCVCMVVTRLLAGLCHGFSIFCKQCCRSCYHGFHRFVFVFQWVSVMAYKCAFWFQCDLSGLLFGVKQVFGSVVLVCIMVLVACKYVITSSYQLCNRSLTRFNQALAVFILSALRSHRFNA